MALQANLAAVAYSCSVSRSAQPADDESVAGRPDVVLQGQEEPAFCDWPIRWRNVSGGCLRIPSRLVQQAFRSHRAAITQPASRSARNKLQPASRSTAQSRPNQRMRSTQRTSFLRRMKHGLRAGGST